MEHNNGEHTLVENKLIKGLSYKTGLYILLGTLASSASFWSGIFYINLRLDNHEYRIANCEKGNKTLYYKVFGVPMEGFPPPSTPSPSTPGGGGKTAFLTYYIPSKEDKNGY